MRRKVTLDTRMDSEWEGARQEPASLVRRLANSPGLREGSGRRAAFQGLS